MTTEFHEALFFTWLILLLGCCHQLYWWIGQVYAGKHLLMVMHSLSLTVLGQMSGRNRGPPLPMKGIPHGGIPPAVHEPAFARGLGPMPHPALLEEFREPQLGWAPNPGRLPPHPAIIEDRLAAQHEDIQGLLVDNQRLAATHVALKQELEAAQYELQRMAQISDSLRADKDVQMRELYDKSVRMEGELRAVEAMRAELSQVNADIKELTTARQELTSRVQVMSQDLVRMTADWQQVPALKADMENMKQEVQRVRYKESDLEPRCLVLCCEEV